MGESDIGRMFCRRQSQSGLGMGFVLGSITCIDSVVTRPTIAFARTCT